MNKNEIYEKNLKGLRTFSELSLAERLEILAEIGILTKDEYGYKLSKDYGGRLTAPVGPDTVAVRWVCPTR